MESMGSQLSVKKSFAFMAVGLLVFILYLYFFVGFEEILVILQQVNPVDYFLYYSLTVAAIALSVLFYSMTWHELLKALSINIGLKKSFIYCWLGNFVDLVLPLETVTGEITRGYLVYNDLKNHFGKTVASLVCHRIISIFTTLSGLIVSSVYLLFRYRVEPYVLYLLSTVTVCTTATIMILFYLSVKEKAAEKLVNALIKLAAFLTRNRLKLVDLKEKAKSTLSVFHQGVKTFGKNPRYLVKPIVYSYVSWFFHLTIYFLVFYALGFSEIVRYFPQMIIVFSISLSVQTIPVGLPVGLVEIVMTSLYVLFGIPPAISGIATSLIRVITFWFQILVGYIIVQLIGIKHILGRNLSKKDSLLENENSK